MTECFHAWKKIDAYDNCTCRHCGKEFGKYVPMQEYNIMKMLRVLRTADIPPWDVGIVHNAMKCRNRSELPYAEYDALRRLYERVANGSKV